MLAQASRAGRQLRWLLAQASRVCTSVGFANTVLVRKTRYASEKLAQKSIKAKMPLKLFLWRFLRPDQVWPLTKRIPTKMTRFISLIFSSTASMIYLELRLV
jgi:hypothetical protein